MKELWEHQIALLNKARRSLSNGNRWIILQLATGGGKTTMATEIVRIHVNSGGKVLWLAHRGELIEQAAKELENAGLSVGAIYPGSTRANPFRPIQVASTQTLQRRDARPEATMVIADECRHYASDKWSPILKYYKEKGCIGIGLDATPSRGDGRNLGDIYDDLISGPPIVDLIKAGTLVPCEILAPRKHLESKQIAQNPISVYKEHAKGKQAVLFAANVKSANSYKEEFESAGYKAGIVTGEDTWGERCKTIEQFKNKELDVLCNVNVLTEGWDYPEISIGILARSCGSIALYLQIVGRFLRSFPGKESALLIDLYGSSRIFGPPETEFVYSLTGEAIQKKDSYKSKYKFCGVCGGLIPEGTNLCIDCGIEREGPGLPEITNTPLYKFGWIRKDAPEQKVERIAKWIRESIDKGINPNSIWYKANSVYGSLTREEWQSAKKLCNERISK